MWKELGIPLQKGHFVHMKGDQSIKAHTDVGYTNVCKVNGVKEYMLAQKMRSKQVVYSWFLVYFWCGSKFISYILILNWNLTNVAAFPWLLKI